LWDDIDAAHQYMLGQGVIPTEIQTRNDGQKAFYVDDRAGNRIELCTKSGFAVLV
jgi:catechol 2,3-dioxygenase-like lactoylglutathione lyase family enzyme